VVVNTGLPIFSFDSGYHLLWSLWGKDKVLKKINYDQMITLSQLENSFNFGHSEWAFRMGIQNGHSGWAFRMGIQDGHSEWAFRMGIQNGHSEWAFRMGIQNGHSEWAFKMGIQNGHSEWAFRMCILETDQN
jgi:hypothetical protein